MKLTFIIRSLLTTLVVFLFGTFLIYTPSAYADQNFTAGNASYTTSSHELLFDITNPPSSFDSGSIIGVRVRDDNNNDILWYNFNGDNCSSFTHCDIIANENPHGSVANVSFYFITETNQTILQSQAVDWQFLTGAVPTPTPTPSPTPMPTQPPAPYNGSWTTVGSMSIARIVHSATLLQNGKVLVAGGNNMTTITELYDPQTQTWNNTGNLNQGRQLWITPGLVTLSDGRVLAATGEGPGINDISSTEIYDPSTGTWAFAANVNTPRREAVVAPLPNGKVLLASGSNNTIGRFITSAEIYDPLLNTWSYTSNMTIGRDNNERYIVLGDGRVMIAGGGSSRMFAENTAEIYDSNTTQWTMSTMPFGFNAGTLTLLPDGKVLAAGGDNGSNESALSAIYDPSTNIWTSTASLQTAREWDQAALLSDGTVMIFGGENRYLGQFYSTSEIYSETSNTWIPGPSLPGAMWGEPVVSLQNGDLLVMGGNSDFTTNLSATYLFTNSQVTPTPTPTPTPVQLTALSPAKVWVGLKTSDDVGVKFDLKVEAYKDTTLVSSGELDSVAAGSSGFSNAKLDTINFNSFSPIDFPSGSQLKMELYIRNACTGSGHNSGTARLWYNDNAANSQFGTTIGSNSSTYYLLDNFLLGTSTGSVKKTIDIQSGAKCSAFKPFGTWSVTP